MKYFYPKLLGFFFLLITTSSMADEQTKYQVIYKEDKIEIRQYSSMVVAEILVNSDMETASSKAFPSLFKYISGNNSKQQKIAMTAPVSQQPIIKTKSDSKQISDETKIHQWLVHFIIPSTLMIETLPNPNNPNIMLRQLPPRLMATIRYSGFWSFQNFSKQKQELEYWLSQSRYSADGNAIWARYNAPFIPWFLRRNEVMIPITDNPLPDVSQ